MAHFVLFFCICLLGVEVAVEVEVAIAAMEVQGEMVPRIGSLAHPRFLGAMAPQVF